MEIREIFENHIKIEPKVMAIETLFNNPTRLERTNYEPFYQRNYVWDDEKATYFIESILLGTEIPPLIFFNNGDKTEVIDGRQRYQTILRFINNDFKLKKNGLYKLIDIANKGFKDLDELKDVFWDTKLRIIVFSFHSKNQINEDIEDIVKKEIFKRYNSGITPLKPTDIDKAIYFDDDLNSFIKDKLAEDKVLYNEVSNVFHFEKSNIEVLLKEIRKLLVLHKVPIKYYSIKKDTVIKKYFDSLFESIDENEIQNLFTGFIEKINLLNKIRIVFSKKDFAYNRLIYECLFWALSIIENEKSSLKDINGNFINELVAYIIVNKDKYKVERSSFAKELQERFITTASFFQNKLDVEFNEYIQITDEFKERDKDTVSVEQTRISFDELRINKPEPSSITIVDIVRQMERQRFLLRPPYQRNEVINKKKSSAIIESILLGIKLPPIFVFKREDGISEVLDGQQRLLSILGYIQKPYLDENNKLKKSIKDGYTLNLKNGILENLNGKKFDKLSTELKDKINEFDLWIIEINQKNNKNFEPIDLFIRLNNKPYPIKENTFEMWNSYIDRFIIEKIKSIHKANKDWFYFRKNNARMDDENIYTFLIYLQYKSNSNKISFESMSQDLDVYKIVDKINFRIKSKNEITNVIENVEFKSNFILACERFEEDFINKLKKLVSGDQDDSVDVLNKNLEFIFDTQRRRTQQSFYALWFFLTNISLNKILTNKLAIREDLKNLFLAMNDVDNKSDFDNKVINFWNKYS